MQLEFVPGGRDLCGHSPIILILNLTEIARRRERRSTCRIIVRVWPQCPSSGLSGVIISPRVALLEQVSGLPSKPCQCLQKSLAFHSACWQKPQIYLIAHRFSISTGFYRFFMKIQTLSKPSNNVFNNCNIGVLGFLQHFTTLQSKWNF